MLIGELARRIGVNVQTIRYYERLGLLPQPARKDSGYRIYSEPALKRLLFIRQAKSLGFSLDEIRDILRMRERGHCPCREVISVAQQHLHAVEQQLRKLTSFRDGLKQAIQQWKGSGEQKLSSDSICVLIERSMEKPALKRQRAKRA